MVREFFHRHIGIRPIRCHKGCRDKRRKIAITKFVLHQQHKLVETVTRECFQCRLFRAQHRHLAPNDGLNTFIRRRHAEFQRTEQIAFVGQRHGGHVMLQTQMHQILTHRLAAILRFVLNRFDGAFRQRIGGMNAQMDEAGISHGVSLFSFFRRLKELHHVDFIGILPVMFQGVFLHPIFGETHFGIEQTCRKLAAVHR